MLSSQQLVVQFPGGLPLGFRLSAGREDRSLFVVAKIRPQSKADQAGLIIGDVVLSINGICCEDLSHMAVTALTDSNETLSFLVLRGKSAEVEAKHAFAGLGQSVRRLTEVEISELIRNQLQQNGTISSRRQSTGGINLRSNYSSNNINNTFRLQAPPIGKFRQTKTDTIEMQKNTSNMENRDIYKTETLQQQSSTLPKKYENSHRKHEVTSKRSEYRREKTENVHQKRHMIPQRYKNLSQPNEIYEIDDPEMKKEFLKEKYDANLQRFENETLQNEIKSSINNIQNSAQFPVNNNTLQLNRHTRCSSEVRSAPEQPKFQSRMEFKFADTEIRMKPVEVVRNKISSRRFSLSLPSQMQNGTSYNDPENISKHLDFPTNNQTNSSEQNPSIKQNSRIQYNPGFKQNPSFEQNLISPRIGQNNSSEQSPRIAQTSGFRQNLDLGQNAGFRQNPTFRQTPGHEQDAYGQNPAFRQNPRFIQNPGFGQAPVFGTAKNSSEFRRQDDSPSRPHDSLQQKQQIFSRTQIHSNWTNESDNRNQKINKNLDTTNHSVYHPKENQNIETDNKINSETKNLKFWQFMENEKRAMMNDGEQLQQPIPKQNYISPNSNIEKLNHNGNENFNRGSMMLKNNGQISNQTSNPSNAAVEMKTDAEIFDKRAEASRSRQRQRSSSLHVNDLYRPPAITMDKKVTNFSIQLGARNPDSEIRVNTNPHEGRWEKWERECRKPLEINPKSEERARSTANEFLSPKQLQQNPTSNQYRQQKSFNDTTGNSNNRFFPERPQQEKNLMYSQRPQQEKNLMYSQRPQQEKNLMYNQTHHMRQTNGPFADQRKFQNPGNSYQREESRCHERDFDYCQTEKNTSYCLSPPKTKVPLRCSSVPPQDIERTSAPSPVPNFRINQVGNNFRQFQPVQFQHICGGSANMQHVPTTYQNSPDYTDL